MGGGEMYKSNYTPISIVMGFVKIFETVIFKRRNDCTVTHKILFLPENRFQKGLFTEDAIYKLINVILTAWNRK
jgi:hypothetical protein